jgi:DNA-binding MarR family transcriptional regulator
VTEPAPVPAGTRRRPATEAEARALASAVRLRILRVCLDRAHTNKEIADRLGLNPASTLHHVRRLVETGFLAPGAERRGTRGAREVPYRATGKSWTLDVHEAMREGRAMLQAFLDEIGEVDLDSHASMARLGLRLSAEEREEFERRLQDVLDEYRNREPTPGGVPYSVFLAIHRDASRSP